MKKLNLSNQTFGKWTVVGEDVASTLANKRTYWLCKCICGIERAVAGTSLTSGISTSCGCTSYETQRIMSAPKYNDFIGRKFGRLLVVAMVEPVVDKEGYKRTTYLCRCECGKEPLIQRHALQNKNGVTSCGCLLFEQRSNLGLSKRKLEPKMATAKIIFDFRYSDGNLTFDDFLRLSQENCYYCGIGPSTTYNKFSHRGPAKTSQYAVDNGNFTYNGLDRIDSNLPHNLENVVAACHPCNYSKSDHNQDEWGKWICKVYDNWAHKYKQPLPPISSQSSL